MNMKSNHIKVLVAACLLNTSIGAKVSAQNEEGEVLISDHEEYLIPVGRENLEMVLSQRKGSVSSCNAMWLWAYTA